MGIWSSDEAYGILVMGIGLQFCDYIIITKRERKKKENSEK